MQRISRSGLGQEIRNLHAKITRREQSRGAWANDPATVFPESIASGMVATLDAEILELNNKLSKLEARRASRSASRIHSKA